jgi:Na+-translocating ferredoxin:NAD+ oxidoreductase RnfC subunit
MIFDFQSTIQRKLFTNLSPEARAVYDRANADYRAARRSVATTEECEASVVADSAELARRKAAVVISAEQARLNVINAYTQQINEGVAVLSSAIDRVKANKTSAVRTSDKAETVSDSKPSLASLLLAAGEE